MVIEIVDFPIKNGDFPWLCGCLPEGNSTQPIYGPWGILPKNHLNDDQSPEAKHMFVKT